MSVPCSLFLWVEQLGGMHWTHSLDFQQWNYIPVILCGNLLDTVSISMLTLLLTCLLLTHFWFTNLIMNKLPLLENSSQWLFSRETTWKYNHTSERTSTSQKHGIFHVRRWWSEFGSQNLFAVIHNKKKQRERKTKKTLTSGRQIKNMAKLHAISFKTLVGEGKERDFVCHWEAFHCTLQPLNG